MLEAVMYSGCPVPVWSDLQLGESRSKIDEKYLIYTTHYRLHPALKGPTWALGFLFQDGFEVMVLPVFVSQDVMNRGMSMTLDVLSVVNTAC